MRFQGKVSLISGAGSGIGRATARAFAGEGARVVLLGRSPSKLEETAALLPAGTTLVTPARHEDPAEARAAVARAVEAFGRLDVLVNNAGVYASGTVADTTPEEWTRVLAANLTGPYLLTREALPHLRATRGAIINVSSTLGARPIPGAAAYAASKAGLNMLTLSTAIEEAANGVRVNGVCPGVVDTPIHAARAGSGPEMHRQFLGQMGTAHPLGRVGSPEEIAALVLFLASAESAWTTGALVTIDGGISLK